MNGINSKRRLSSSSKKKGAAAASAFAIFAVAVLLISSIPMPAQGIPATAKAPEETYSGDYYVVRYYANYPSYRDIIDNALGHRTGDDDDPFNKGFQYGNRYTVNIEGNSYEDFYVDVPSYGSIVSTEYNPQLWADTVVTSPEISWNWLEPIKYVADSGEGSADRGTVVFTGWEYRNAKDEAPTVHYPGEVFSNSALECAVETANTTNNNKVKVLEVYATWDTAKDVRLVTGSGGIVDGRESYTFQQASTATDWASQSMYTNFILIYAQRTGSSDNRCTVSINSDVTTKAPVTIRSDPISQNGDNGHIGRIIANSNGRVIRLGADTVIDNVALLMGGSGTNHGGGVGGIYATGNALIIGTGILSLHGFKGNNDIDSRRGLTQLTGGSSGGALTDPGRSHDVGVYMIEEEPDEEGNPRTYPGPTSIKTMMIVHSGTWSDIVGAGRSNFPGCIYMVIKNATILDTLEGGPAGGSGSSYGSVYMYVVNTKMPGDIYEMRNLNLANSIPRLIGSSAMYMPAWPYLIDSESMKDVPDGNGVSSFGSKGHTESSIITGGSGGSETIQNTFIYVSGESEVWDAQAAGRTPSKSKVTNGTVELSGKATVAHILCGSTTDGNKDGDRESIKNTHIVVKDSGKAGTVCGAGFDTSYDAVYATMMNGGSIVVEIKGGTVCDVFGGGFRALTGTASKPIDDVSITISGGKVLGDVYGGGSGGFNKKRHDVDGRAGSAYGFSDPAGDKDTTGRSRVFANDVYITITGDAVIEGSVYGGGKSVPAIIRYSGQTWFNESASAAAGRGDVAALVCQTLTVTVNENAVVEGDVYGGGKGVPDIVNGRIAGENPLNYSHMTTISRDGEREYLPWFTNPNNSENGVAVFAGGSYLDNYAKVSGPTVNGQTTSAEISVSITDNAKIGSCVLGAGGRSPTFANTGVAVDGKAEIAGSVYGGGLMRLLTGNTDVYVGGSATVLYSVYGGGDIGIRDSGSDAALILVIGNSKVTVDGAQGASVGKSIMGEGNSCLVCDADGNPGNRIIAIRDYSPDHTMESIQNASVADVVRSSMALSGRASSASASPSDMMSLYGIDDLRMIGGSSLNLRSNMHNIKGYGSYVDSSMALTSVSNPMNSFNLGAGVMFNTAYDSERAGQPYTEYGMIYGYTILGHDISDDYYGAFAYGNLTSDGRFVQYKDGLLEPIPFVDKPEGDSHDAFKLWTMIGSIKRSVSLVAVGNGTAGVLNSFTTFELMPVSTDGSMFYVGANVVMTNSEAGLVENVSDIDGYNDFRITFGYGDSSKVLTFNDGTGIAVMPDTTGIVEGEGTSSICKVNISLDHWGEQRLTGLVGKAMLEFQEMLIMEVGGASVPVPVCTNIVEVSLYCSESMSTFASHAQASEVEHVMTILIDRQNSGKDSFVIPYGYRNGIMTLESYSSDVDIDMRTDINSYGSQGWIGAVGKGGSLEECMGMQFKLSGSFSATLAFTVSDVTDLDAEPVLHFKIDDGSENWFSLRIVFAEKPGYTVKFYSQKYSYDALRSLLIGGNVSIAEPPYNLVKTAHVDHGSQIMKSQFPMTYDQFVGWYRDPECTRHFDTTTAITEDLELFARYAFTATFEIPSGNEVVPMNIVTRDVAHLEAVYEDISTPATATFSGAGSAIGPVSGHIGSSFVLPDPGDGCLGWVLNGYVYGVGEPMVMFEENMRFSALYESEDEVAVSFSEYVNSHRNTSTLSSTTATNGQSIVLPGYTGSNTGFVGWTLNGSFYEPDASILAFGDRMDFIALFEDGHNATVVYGDKVVTHQGGSIRLPTPGGEFSGWLVDGVFYGPNETITIIERDDCRAIPVFVDEMMDVTLAYIDNGTETLEEAKYGSTFALRSNTSEGFLGWYHDGTLYGSGDMFTVSSDERTEFTAIYEGQYQSYVFPDAESGAMGWVWNDRFYEPRASIIVPVDVTVSPEAISEDASVVVSVDAGRNAMSVSSRVGRTVPLAAAPFDAGFKGWLADGRLYQPGYEYRIMDDSSPLNKLQLSETALDVANLGYTTDGEWYDVDETLRFDNIPKTEHLICDTTYHMKWEGVMVELVFVAYDGDVEIDMSAYSGTEVRYGGPFGDVINQATEFVKDKTYKSNVRWEYCKYQGGLERTGVFVYDGSILEVPNFNTFVQRADGTYTVYLMADSSDESVTIELSPGQQYVPHKVSNIKFEAVYIDETAQATATFMDSGSEAAPSIATYVGAKIALPVPNNEDFVGWICNGELYKKEYLVRSPGTIEFDAFKKTDEASSAVFTLDDDDTQDTQKGRFAEFPDKESINVTGTVGDSISLPRVVDDGNWKFIGWLLDGRLIRDYTFMSAEQKTLTAAFCPLDSSETATLRFVTGDHGVLVDSAESVSARVGFITDLPVVAPKDGYRFAGWKIVSENDMPNGEMAEDSGSVYAPETFFVYPGDNPKVEMTCHLGDVVTFDPPEEVPEGMTFVGWNYNGVTYSVGEEFVVMDSGTVLVTPVYIGSDAVLRFVRDSGTTEIHLQVGDSFIPSPANTGQTLNSPWQWLCLNTGDVHYSTSAASRTPVEVTDTEMTFIPVYCKGKIAVQFRNSNNGIIGSPYVINATRTNTFTVPDYSGNVPEGKEFVGFQFSRDTYMPGGAIEFYMPGDTFHGHRYPGLTDKTPMIFRPVFVDTSMTQTLTFSPGGTYMFHFNDALRQGYDLAGWSYAQYNEETGSVEHAVLPTGKIAKIDHMRPAEGNDYYILYYTDSSYYVVPSTVRFIADWKSIEYIVEIQSPHEAGSSISWKWTISADGTHHEGGSVDAHQSPVSIKVKYGDQLELTYHHAAGSKYSFSKWNKLGEGKFRNETSLVSQLDVIGNASVFVTMSTTYDRILTVYNPEEGKISIDNYKSFEPGDGFVEYRVVSSSIVRMTYTSDSGREEIYRYYANGEASGSVITVNQDTTVIPYLKIRSTDVVMTMDKRAIFVENDEGSYLVRISDLQENAAEFIGGVVSLSYAKDAEATFEHRWDGSTLEIAMNGKDLRGIIPAEITIYGPGASSATIDLEVYVIPVLVAW